MKTFLFGYQTSRLTRVFFFDRIHKAKRMAYVAPNGVWLSRSAALQPPALSAGSYIEAIANGTVRLASLQSSVSITSETRVDLGTAALPGLLQVGLDADTVAVEARALDVRAGQVLVREAGQGGGVVLAAGQSTAAALHGAGISVGGGDGAGAALATEQSIRWSRGFGELPASEAAATAAAGGRSNAGAWDVRGGGLRLVAETAQGEVAYGFRINAHKELELYRRDIPIGTSNHIYRRVHRFGNSLDSNGGALMIPVSPAF